MLELRHHMLHLAYKESVKEWKKPYICRLSRV